MRRILPLLLLAACSAPDPGLDSGGDAGDEKADRGGGTGGFLEVDPSHSSAAFRGYVAGALAVLERHPEPVARLTARSIREGRVRIDEIADLTCWDFERLRGELGDLGLEAGDFARLRAARSPVVKAISGEIDGYMWSNRVYVSRGQTALALASTLVHEVNHVINRSDIGYYDDPPTSELLHEYRAFHAQRLVDPAPLEGVDLVDHVISLYELDRDKIPAEILADPLTPRLLPDAVAWRERRAAEDPADDDAACPGNR